MQVVKRIVMVLAAVLASLIPAAAAEQFPLGPIGARAEVTPGSAVAVIVSVAIVWIDGGVDWSRFLRSWLTAFIFVLSLALGGLFLVIVHHGMRGCLHVRQQRHQHCNSWMLPCLMKW